MDSDKGEAARPRRPRRTRAERIRRIVAWRRRRRAAAEAAGERLDLLKARHCRRGQALPARVVLGDARDPDSPLHDHFDWDDSAAAGTGG